MKKMGIETITRRDIQETWEIEIQDNDDPRDVFESIVRDPNKLWLLYNPILIDAQDIDETVAEVTRFEVD
jgi:hypothetical protein